MSNISGMFVVYVRQLGSIQHVRHDRHVALALLLGRRQAAGGGGQCPWRFRGAKTEERVMKDVSLEPFLFGHPCLIMHLFQFVHCYVC